MILEQIPSRLMANFVYLFGDEVTRKAAVVDPSHGGEKALKLANLKGFTIERIFITHGHSDHISDIGLIKRDTGALVVAHETSRIEKDIAVSDNETISLGTLGIKAIHTPGHTPDSACYLVEGNLFTGDTLFVG